jgi:hypothetical protein
VAAEKAWRGRRSAGTLKPALSPANCDLDADLPPANRITS